MDISSEMIHALLPVFLVVTLGAGTEMVGLIEGVGEGTASITKLFSGWLSDRLGKRKALAVAGYAMGALSKPVFALAPAAGWVLGARFADRVGKGVRGAPRDALVGDLAPPGMSGAAFGLRQSLDTVGAFLGPLLAVLLMAASGNDIRLVFWLALPPGLAAVALLAVAVRDPPRTPQQRGVRVARAPLRRSELALLGPRFRALTLAGSVLTLARFGEAFLVLRARSLGLPLALTPLVLVVMNVVYGLAAYPAGRLADRLDRRGVLAAGFGVLVAADLALGLAPGLLVGMAGIALFGLHMGLTQGVLAALVSDAAPAEARGTAFGVFHLASGLALLAASLLAGFAWQVVGPAATFLASAAFAVTGLALLYALVRG
ncbi:MAG: MFS transporter [Rhodospirillales bacterium]|nr:MFS transporter [Rhodospirillales bacterium]